MTVEACYFQLSKRIKNSLRKEMAEKAYQSENGINLRYMNIAERVRYN